MLLGIQQSYTNYCCFLSEWGSCDKKHRHVCKDWPQGHTFTPENMNIRESARCISPPYAH
jgi:hypothetical protein